MRIVVLLEILIGYTNTKNWNADAYYNYSWVLIATIMVLIILVAVQSTKQFIDQEQGSKGGFNTEANISEK
jgi:high-affinity Fe2+/Pb2+ permease